MKNILIQVMCILSCGWMLSNCTEAQVQEVTKTIFVDYASLSMFVGEKIKITASPTDETFTWESDDIAVATVSASGEVRATGVGETSITVSYGDVQRTIPIDVEVEIPVTDIDLGTASLELIVGKNTTLTASLIPANANERGSFKLESENNDIARVSDYGEVLAVGKGETNIVCRFGNVTATVHVTVLVQLNKTGWSVIDCSEEQENDGGGKGAIIDGILSSSNYWRSRWSAPIGDLPQWVVIDMVSPQKINKIETYRRFEHTKTVQYLVGDNPAPNAASWVKIMEGMFDEVNNLLTISAPENNIQGRYLKIFMPDSYADTHTNISEIYVYGK